LAAKEKSVSIGVSDDHTELAATVRKWAAALGPHDATRAAEAEPDESFDAIWAAVGEMGLATIALPESAGGGGGSVLDQAVALEAAAHELVPGRLFSASVAAICLRGAPEVAAALSAGERFAVGLLPTLTDADGALTGEVRVVLDAPGADRLLLGAGERWYVVPADRALIEPHSLPDLTRRAGTVTFDAVPVGDVVEVPGLTTAAVRRAAVVVAAAEAAGVARWCLNAAVEYAKVREQFGQKIGSFQAVKHLCAGMLEQAESVTAAAWDAAAAYDDEGGAFAAEVSGVVAVPAAIEVAKTCIQVLGGIGFTFEHDAHLYLRRVLTLQSLLGGAGGPARDLATRAVAGERRAVRIDFGGRDEEFRPAVRERVAAIAALDAGEQRTALVEAGYLAPHWPAPYGLGAGPVEQLVVDEELSRAGVSRPDLKIGAWAVPTILGHGSDRQREQFVRPTMLGELTWCQLFSEPEAGSDLAALRTRAERVDGGWALTGQKVWTTLAHASDWAICLARTAGGAPGGMGAAPRSPSRPDAPQHKGISYFLLDMTSPGIEIRPLRELTGDAMFNEVFLDGVLVPDEYVVGEIDDGWRLARATLASERVAMANRKLGLSTERAVELAASGVDPELLTRVGHEVATATVTALLGVRATLRSLAGQPPGAESSVAKLIGVRSRQDSAELVVELMGDRVLTGEADPEIHEMLLTRCLSIAGGTTQILRNVTAERLLGLPR
jgi:alkylation response protein AidB-like acyl-CoA dehydrogenase